MDSVSRASVDMSSEDSGATAAKNSASFTVSKKLVYGLGIVAVVVLGALGVATNGGAGDDDADATTTTYTTSSTYVGCFVDNTNGERDLVGDNNAVVKSVVATNVGSTKGAEEQCALTCASQGFRYMGLQWVDQCFCGNQMALDDTATDSGDSDACGAGGRNTLCGNGETNCGNHNAVYRLHKDVGGAGDSAPAPPTPVPAPSPVPVAGPPPSTPVDTDTEQQKLQTCRNIVDGLSVVQAQSNSDNLLAAYLRTEPTNPDDHRHENYEGSGLSKGMAICMRCFNADCPPHSHCDWAETPKRGPDGHWIRNPVPFMERPVSCQCDTGSRGNWGDLHDFGWKNKTGGGSPPCDVWFQLDW